jgi:hypothetical protein
LIVWTIPLTLLWRKIIPPLWNLRK